MSPNMSGCARCPNGDPGDHGGSNTAQNIQLVCAPRNYLKGASLVYRRRRLEPGGTRLGRRSPTTSRGSGMGCRQGAANCPNLMALFPCSVKVSLGPHARRSLMDKNIARTAGAVIGGAAGLVIAGPPGAFAGATAGGLAGDRLAGDKKSEPTADDDQS